jgi:16S rRNA (cytidine1402-2'-O)-methyltransferase
VLAFGKLYLIPVPISTDEATTNIPAKNILIVKSLVSFIAENTKQARAHLKLFGYENLQLAKIEELNQHLKEEEHFSLLKPLLDGDNVGLMSDAGCPAIADPGATIVSLAHKKGIQVIPLTGPSSLVLSIMASGFNGQNFAFVGYLPVERVARIKRIKELEMIAIRFKQAQFFIETPYRNDQIFELLLQTLAPGTLLYIGINLNALNSNIKSQTIQEWRKQNKISMSKIPVVFGIYA